MDIRMTISVMALALLLTACAGTGATSDAQTTANESVQVATASDGGDAKSTDPDDEVVCKKIVKTGTRLRETFCAPRSAWEKSEEYGQKATEQMQSKPIYKDGNSTGGGL